MKTSVDVQLQETLFHDKVAAARRMNPGEKLFCGVRLFDDVRRRMLAGSRSRNPAWRDDEIEVEFRRQLAIARQLDERGVYSPCGHP